MSVITPGYQPRLADGYLAELLADFPAVMITGPRASGKTTTASQHVDQIVRLDEPGVAATYRADPDAALRRASRPVLLDEWQEVPDVLPAVKRCVDRDATPGQFVLTGSVRADLLTETWAGTGRIVRMSMYPVAERERRLVAVNRPSFLSRLAFSGGDDLAVPDEPPNIDEYVALALRGGFPEVSYRDRSSRSRTIWLSSYLDDLVTRDAAGARDHPKDPVKLRRYIAALALNNAGLPTETTLLRAANVNAKTAAAYDQLLRNLYVLDIVPAWASNRLSRVTKQGKRYLVDSGLASAAAGLDAAMILNDADLTGRWFDGYATAQLRPEVALSHPRAALHHLRLEAGRREIDLVVEVGDSRVVGIEFKAGSAPDERDARHLFWLRDQLGDSFAAGAVVHTGPGIYPLGDRVYAVPLCAMWT